MDLETYQSSRRIQRVSLDALGAGLTLPSAWPDMSVLEPAFVYKLPVVTK